MNGERENPQAAWRAKAAATSGSTAQTAAGCHRDRSHFAPLRGLRRAIDLPYLRQWRIAQR